MAIHTQAVLSTMAWGVMVSKMEKLGPSDSLSKYADTGTIGVGLVDAHAPGDNTLRLNRGFVIGNLCMTRHAQDALVHKREMGNVQKILDQAWPTRFDLIGATQNLAICSVVPLREGRNIVGWLAECHPDQLVTFLHPVGFDHRLRRRGLVGMRRDAHAAPGHIVGPAVIGTRQQPICHLTQGEPGAAMQTHILPRLNLAAVTPDDYVLSQQ